MKNMLVQPTWRIFWSEKYFIPYKEEIKKQFTPKSILILRIINIYQIY